MKVRYYDQLLKLRHVGTRQYKSGLVSSDYEVIESAINLNGHPKLLRDIGHPRHQTKVKQMNLYTFRLSPVSVTLVTPEIRTKTACYQHIPLKPLAV
jgi:hypothetical protein